MFRTDTARIGHVERTGVPLAPVLAGLLGALATGYLLTSSITMAFGFLGFMGLFCVTVLYPEALVPGLVVLTVFIEASLQSLSITAGGRELLNFGGIVNLGLVAAVLFYTVMGRMRPFESLVTPSFALYVGAVVFSLLISVDFMMTARSIVRICAGFCIYLMITQFLTEKRQIDRTFRILVLISAVPITVGLYQIAFHNHFVVSRDMRIPGTLNNGMSYAMYMAFILPYLFGQMAFNRGSRLKTVFFTALFIAGVMNLVYSSTRIGLGVFSFTMVVYALLTDAKRLLPVIVVVMLVVIIVCFPFFVKSFGGFFKTDWSTYMSNDIRWDFRSQDYITASSLHIRIFVWRTMFHKLMEINPWLGAGSGTWFENFDERIIGFPIASHSDYFEVLFGVGFIGFALYMLFRIRQVTLLARFAGSGIERQIKTTVLYPCLATHLGCLGMSITEVWQGYSAIYWMSWITIGISEAYYRWFCAQESTPSPAFAQLPLDGTYN